MERLIDLAEQSYSQERGLDSDFLTPDEFSTFMKNIRAVQFANPTIYDENWERKLIHFGEGEPEICIFKINSRSSKFVKLSHRDYLGAILGLGIERKLIGDILVHDDVAFVFIKNSIADFLCMHLHQVGRASVDVQIIEKLPEQFQPKRENEEVILSSLRLDRFISTVFHTPRKESVKAIESGEVFVNSCQLQKIHYTIKDGDIISYRRKGKCKYLQTLRTTKKESFVIEIERFV